MIIAIAAGFAFFDPFQEGGSCAGKDIKYGALQYPRIAVGDRTRVPEGLYAVQGEPLHSVEADAVQAAHDAHQLSPQHDQLRLGEDDFED